MATCEVAWLRKLLGDLGLHVDKLVVIYCDNLSNIQLARNPMFHARTKHMRFIITSLGRRSWQVKLILFMSAQRNRLLTSSQGLGAEKHRQFRNMLGVMELELSLKGSVEMSSSIRANTHDVHG
jgi:hypothetical protein